jgi:hypothetical protein
MKHLLLTKLALTQHVPLFTDAALNRQHQLRNEAEITYDLLCALMDAVNYDHPDLLRIRRIARRAHVRCMRRAINAPCDECGKPATRQIRSSTGTDMETARPVSLCYCAACYERLFGEVSHAA